MNCRFGPKHNEPFDLLPGTNDIPCTVTVFAVGEFSSEMHVFFDDGGVREFALGVRGVGILCERGNTEKKE